MAKEIERKFLVDLDKLGDLSGGSVIKQAFLSTSDTTAVRVRVCGENAYLTLKGETRDLVRSEFEYAIPVSDAEVMIQELCSGLVIEKTRYPVEFCGHTWEVDVFHGENDGLVVAELELESEDESFERPEWVAEEVSGEARYYNVNLARNPFCNWKNT